MRRSIWILLPYATAVAGYAGWRGVEVWNGWVIWVLALAPLALAVYVVAYELRRHRSVRTAFIVGVIPVLSCAWIALCGLGLAWIFADTAKLWTAPALRAGISAGLTALVVGFVIAGAERRRTRREANNSEPDLTSQPQ